MKIKRQKKKEIKILNSKEVLNLNQIKKIMMDSKEVPNLNQIKKKKKLKKMKIIGEKEVKKKIKKKKKKMKKLGILLLVLNN